MTKRNPGREAAEIELACAVAHAAEGDERSRKHVAYSILASSEHQDARRLLVIATYRQLRLARRLAALLDMTVEEVLAGDLDQQTLGDGAAFMEVLRLARMPAEQFDEAEAYASLARVFPFKPYDTNQAATTEGEATP